MTHKHKKKLIMNNYLSSQTKIKSLYRKKKEKDLILKFNITNNNYNYNNNNDDKFH